MRTTVSLDPEAEALIRAAMRDRGVGFKQVVNEAIVRGLGSRDQPASEFSTPVFDMGAMSIPGHRALALAAEMEDEELIRKSELGK